MLCGADEPGLVIGAAAPPKGFTLGITIRSANPSDATVRDTIGVLLTLEPGGAGSTTSSTVHIGLIAAL